MTQAALKLIPKVTIAPAQNELRRLGAKFDIRLSRFKLCLCEYIALR
jgi:hypothetical protein